MRPKPGRIYEITYDPKTQRYVKKAHRSDCPRIKVPRPRSDDELGRALVDLKRSIEKAGSAQPSAPAPLKESEEQRTWLTPARATVLAAIITGLFLIVGVWLTAVLRDPTPAPTPLPSIYVNQEQVNQNR